MTTAATTGGIPTGGADGLGIGGSAVISAPRLRGQYFQMSHAMTATTTTGKPMMSASCNARHWISRLHTEPMISASAMVRMKVLR